MKIKKFLKSKKGFTLIELLIVIGIIAVLMGIAIVAVNPGQQFAKANNARRWGDVGAVANAIAIRIIDNKGDWPVTADCLALPTTDLPRLLKDPCVAGEYCYDLCECLIPDYFGSMPADPSAGVGGADCDNYDSGYTLDRVGTRIKISATAQEEGGVTPVISVTR